MHGLGVVGMSRRVPEYADVYAPYLQIGSIGALYVVASVLLTLRLLSVMGLGASQRTLQPVEASSSTSAIDASLSLGWASRAVELTATLLDQT